MVCDFAKIIFSGKAHFHLDGYVNKQNYHMCGTENPCIIEEKSILLKKSLFTPNKYLCGM